VILYRRVEGSAQTSVPACGTVPQNLADYVREFTVSDPHRHLAGKAATGTIREGSGRFYCAEIPLDILRILAARCPLLGRLNLHFQRQRFLLSSSKDFAEALSPIRHTFATLCIRQPHWDGMPASVIFEIRFKVNSCVHSHSKPRFPESLVLRSALHASSDHLFC
jgi:hypothetical protein